ncbi:MAG: peptidylprolyl isomerase [Mariprofundales bacterium]
MRKLMVALSFVWGCCVTPTAALAEQVDALAAVVGTGAITCYDVRQSVDTMMRQMQLSGAVVPPRAQVEKRVLHSKVDEQLQLQQAKRLDLTVSDDDINQAMSEVEKRNKIPAGELASVLKAQGVDIADYRQQLHNQQLIGKVINIDVRSKIQVSEESMREYYRKYLEVPKPVRELHLSRIVLTLPAEPTPAEVEAVGERLDNIRARIVAGETLASLAPLLSDGQRAASGGDIGWHFVGSMPMQFRDFLGGKVGDLSAPIRMADGMNLLQIDAERWHDPEVGEPYDEVHARHILFRIPTDADEATRAKILHRVREVADEMATANDAAFATRAKELSQGPSGKNGGDLGWFKRGDMAKVFEDTAFSLPEGGTSGVVTSQFGLHVIRVVAKRHVDPNAFAVHKPKIEQQLLSLEMRSQLPRWLAGLRQKTLIEMRSCQ